MTEDTSRYDFPMNYMLQRCREHHLVAAPATPADLIDLQIGDEIVVGLRTDFNPFDGEDGDVIWFASKIVGEVEMDDVHINLMVDTHRFEHDAQVRTVAFPKDGFSDGYLPVFVYLASP